MPNLIKKHRVPAQTRHSNIFNEFPSIVLTRSYSRDKGEQILRSVSPAQRFEKILNRIGSRAPDNTVFPTQNTRYQRPGTAIETGINVK